jgi:hypothetical protein
MGKWLIKGVMKFVLVGALITWGLMGVLGHSTGIRTSAVAFTGFAGSVGAFVGILPSGGDSFRAGKAEADRAVNGHSARPAAARPGASRPTLRPRPTPKPTPRVQLHPITGVRH